MAVAEATPRVATPAPRPWWRGRLGLVVAVALGMLAAFFGSKNDVLWPKELTWNALPGHLDRFQTWLSDHRHLEQPSVVFRIFNGFASFLDDLLSSSTPLFHDLPCAPTAP